MKGRKHNAVVHIYQRSLHGFNLFYSFEDYLLFYTLVSVMKKKYDVVFLGHCIMVDHFHSLVKDKEDDSIRRMFQQIIRIYAREFNKEIKNSPDSCSGRTKSVFAKSFGRAKKVNDKSIRTAISYLYNNPVEKKLCVRAEDYRWNFLAYADSRNPFSERLVLRYASRKLRRCIKLVDFQFKEGRYLTYAFIRNLFSGLSGKQKRQLVDYIIVKYNFIDYESLVNYYGDFQKMLLAINSNTGSEYEFDEDTYGGSDQIYRILIEHTQKYLHTSDVKLALRLEVEDKLKLYKYLASQTSANSKEIEKFIHLSFLRCSGGRSR